MPTKSAPATDSTYRRWVRQSASPARSAVAARPEARPAKRRTSLLRSASTGEDAFVFGIAALAGAAFVFQGIVVVLGAIIAALIAFGPYLVIGAVLAVIGVIGAFRITSAVRATHPDESRSRLSILREQLLGRFDDEG